MKSVCASLEREVFVTIKKAEDEMSKGTRFIAKALMPFIGRMLERRLVAGWSTNEALAEARAHIGIGYHVTLNNLVEHASNREVVNQNVEEALTLIQLMRNKGIVASLAVKPSSIGGAVCEEGGRFNEVLFRKNLVRILDALTESPEGVELEIDAEGYATCDDVWKVVCGVRCTHKEGYRLRAALQMHLCDLEQKLHEAQRVFLSLRIVKGAPVYADAEVLRELSPKELDRRARAVFHALIRGGSIPYGAVMWSRDTALAFYDIGEYFHTIAKPPPYKIQMLHGIGRDLTLELCRLGVPISIYMAYLPEWAKREEAKEYMIRRVQSGIELFLRKITHWF